MKRMTTWLCLITAAGLLALTLWPVTATGQDDSRPAPPPRISTGTPGGAMNCPMPPPYAARCRGLLRCVLSILAVIHVMLAVWVYTDIRKRGEGHGIFIVLALLGGIPATILYALVRIGDRKV